MIKYSSLKGIMNKNTNLNIMKRKLKRKVFDTGLLIIDLMELSYNKLNYIKLNYKNMLLSIFEEKDNNTSGSISKYHESTNKYIDLIISYLLILVGYKEEEVLVILGSNTNNFSFFHRKSISDVKLNFLITLFTILLFWVLNLKMIL